MLPAFWGIVAGVVVIGTFVVGFYPSWLMVTIRPSEIMRGKLVHGKRGNRIRKVLIVVQFLASDYWHVHSDSASVLYAK